MRVSKINPLAAFALANFAFAVLLVIGATISRSGETHSLYLLSLFVLCTSPIIVIRRFNDRYALLVIFSIVYFTFYGFLDVTHLFLGPADLQPSSDPQSDAERVILCGGLLAFVGYHVGCRSFFSRGTSAGDWPERVLEVVGLAMWLICTALTWKFRVYVISDVTIDATQRGLASLGSMQIAGFILAQMLQPVGILIIAYTQARYQRPYMLPVVIFVILVQLAFGFTVDVKGDALIGGVLVILTKTLVEGRLPKTWLVGSVIFLVLAFPILQANRWVRGEYGLNHGQVASSIGDTLQKAIAGSTRVTTESERAQTVFERMSLKGSVELIVSRTGVSVPFQDGYTLSPLVTTLIPRVIWPSKPDVQAGQVMNKEFQVSEVADTYISPSHLGELYWNFGWSGVAIGMFSIGLLLGVVGKGTDLSQSVGITRLLVMIVTIRLLVLGFEGSIAVQYSQWIRSLLAIGVLHLLLASRSSSGSPRQHVTPSGEGLDAVNAPPSFPNLMK
jgi:hypothetical protein